MCNQETCPTTSRSFEPFHRTVIQTIHDTANSSELELIGRLIASTVIPEDHNNIIAAWQKRWEELVGIEEPDQTEVVPSLEAQRKVVEFFLSSLTGTPELVSRIVQSSDTDDSQVHRLKRMLEQRTRSLKQKLDELTKK